MINWLLGLDPSSEIETTEVIFAASWVAESTFWLLLALMAAVLCAVLYYRQLHRRGSLLARALLGTVRALLLMQLVLTLADPFLRVVASHSVRPTICLLFDGTESMQTADVDTIDSQSSGRSMLTRVEAVRSALREESQIFQGLANADCRLEAFQFDGQTTSRLRRLANAESPAENRLTQICNGLTTTGQVSALGEALDDFTGRHARRNMAALVLVSDFAHNSGLPPTSNSGMQDLRALGIEVFTVGVGKDQLADVSLALHAEPRIKRGEVTSLMVTLQQSELAGRTISVTVRARRVESQPAAAASEVEVGTQTVTLQDSDHLVQFSFVPEQTGLWEFEASVEAVTGEVSLENNRALQRSTVTDDFLRLLYVASQPSWEWRFVKEAYHRDPLVGAQGFRTYLDSADAEVRRQNDLFLEFLPLRRDELFAFDAILIDDVPRSALSEEFAEMLEEFVGRMGGGLVYLAGPRYGTRELVGSQLAEMLPVKIDNRMALSDEPAFDLELTADANLFSFMRLADSDDASRTAWENLNPLPWYQPIAAVSEQAYVLARHPTDVCDDNQTKQPLLAVRRYGRGEVVFCAFNEFWRLRRDVGERYHRRFWSQLIYRLGMSHALGDEKRFVARTDRDQYRVGDLITLRVDAYDGEYRSLTAESPVLPDGSLEATLSAVSGPAGNTTPRPIAIPWVGDEVFESRFRVSQPGHYSLEVKDPVTGGQRRLHFAVSRASAERRDQSRNRVLQQELARQTGGRSYELTSGAPLLPDLPMEPRIQQRVWTHPLWSTPLWFALAAGMMLVEWTARRWIHLR